MALTKVDSGLVNQLASANMPTGSVLQVVQGVYTTQASFTSTSFTATGLTVSITPKFANSKILVITNFAFQSTSSGNNNLTIYRNSTNLGNSTNGFGYMTTNANTLPGMQYLDSPATTSAITYTVYTKVTSGTVWINVGSETSTITVMEIAG